MSDFQQRAVADGKAYERVAAEYLEQHLGWKIIGTNVRHPSGIQLDIHAQDLDGNEVAVECKGGRHDRPGLQRSDNIWKVCGQALGLHNWNRAHPAEHLRFLVVASSLPHDDGEAMKVLRVAIASGQVGMIDVPHLPEEDREER